MIFSDVRDPRLVTIRRGGTLADADHHLLAVWAADCAEHVLHYFEQARPADERPRRAIELARAWARGEATMTQARTAAGPAHGAARDMSGAARAGGSALGFPVRSGNSPSTTSAGATTNAGPCSIAAPIGRPEMTAAPD